MHATVTADWARDVGDALTPMDDGGDAFPVFARPYLAVDLHLGPNELDRKVAGLGAHASQTGPLQQALGRERYRAFVAADWFRRAGMQASQGMVAAP